MQRQKILIVINNLEVGGTERHLLQVLPRINSNKFVIEVFVLSHRGVLADYLEQQGINVISIHSENAWCQASRFRKYLLLIKSTYSLYRYLKTNKVKIIHFFLPMSYLIGGICALLTNVPYRIMSRRSLNLYQQHSIMLYFLERFLHKYITVAVANSSAVVFNLQQEGLPINKLKLIYNGIDLDNFNIYPKLNKENNKNNNLKLIIVANLRPYKGHLDLLDALAKISQQLLTWELLCVGKNINNFQEILENKAIALNINYNIKFLGLRSDIPDLLLNSDIAISCSHEEGFSNSILEAMAAGLPLVVTDVGGNSEAVIHEETGLIVPARNPEKLAQAILSLANDKDKCIKMGQAARKRVIDKFSITTCVTEYEKLYANLV